MSDEAKLANIKASQDEHMLLASVLDTSRLQEMLKRQMTSTRHRTTWGIENDRIQSLLRKEFEHAKGNNEIVEGENERFHVRLRQHAYDLNDQTVITRQELNRFEALTRQHLSELKDELSLPKLPNWKEGDYIQGTLDLVLVLAREVTKLREESRELLTDTEDRVNEREVALRIAITDLQKEVNMKKQHLQELNTSISREELAMKEEKKKFLAKMRPKTSHLERLTRLSTRINTRPSVR
jgi:hypothetical protein